MFIQSEHGGHWNLQLVANYRRDEKSGLIHLVFPVDGGNVKIRPTHPQYRQIERHLAASTLGPDLAV